MRTSSLPSQRPPRVASPTVVAKIPTSRLRLPVRRGRRRPLRLGQRLRLAVPPEDRPEDEQGRREDDDRLRLVRARASAPARCGSRTPTRRPSAASRPRPASGSRRSPSDRPPTTRRSRTAPPGRPRTGRASSSASTRRRTRSSRAGRSTSAIGVVAAFGSVWAAGSNGVHPRRPRNEQAARNDPRRRRRRVDGRFERRCLGDDADRARAHRPGDEHGRRDRGARRLRRMLGDPDVVGGQGLGARDPPERDRSSSIRRRTPSRRRSRPASALSS